MYVSRYITISISWIYLRIHQFQQQLGIHLIFLITKVIRVISSMLVEITELMHHPLTYTVDWGSQGVDEE
jgi:hypothetical protein